MEQKTMLSAEQLRGFAVVANACAEALVNLPSEAVVANTRAVAEALELDWFADVRATPELEQRYYDRFFVSSHPAYVPLYEDSIRAGFEEDGRFHYGTTDGRYFEHTLKCYQAVGFDYRRIQGFDLTISKLKPDSLASELAFLAFLAQAAVEHAESDPAVAQRSAGLFQAFARDHASRWFQKAADCLARFEDDFYTRTVLLAADALLVMGEGE